MRVEGAPRRQSRISLWVALGALACNPGAVDAATDLEATVTMGAVDTDNVAHTEVGQSSQVLVAIGAFEVIHQQPTLDFDLDANVSLRKYSEGELGSRTVPQARGFLAWEAIPDTLRLVVEDALGQVGSAPSQSLLPVDLENLNVVAVGPDLLLLADQAQRIRLRGRYTQADYQKSNLDSERVYGEVRGERDLSFGGFAYLVGSAGSTKFKTERGGGYDLQSIAIGADIAGRRTSLVGEVGAARAKDQGEETTGMLLRMEASRRLSTRSLVRLTLLSTFGDSADVFSASQQFEDTLGDTVILELDAGLGRQELAALAYEYDSGRMQVSLEGGWQRQSDFSDGSSDRSVVDGEVTVAYSFRPTFRFGGYARTGRQRSDTATFQLTDTSAGVFAEWRFTEPARVHVSAERYRRDDAPQNYKEARYTIEVLWNVLQRRGPSPGPDSWSLRRQRTIR